MNYKDGNELDKLLQGIEQTKTKKNNEKKFDKIPKEKKKLITKIAGITGIVMIGIGLLFLGTWIVQLLWNWLMPLIFKLPTLNFWQTMGLTILSHLLFGSSNFKMKK